jgi:tRNA-dihydrouridine synthase
MLKGKDAPDLSVFRDIPDDIFLIGNNSVRGPEGARAILEYCDAFSFARIADDHDAVHDIISQV